MNEHGRLAVPVETFSTKQVSERLGVLPATLMLWAREGRVSPLSEGAGRQRRLQWKEEDVQLAQRIRDEGKTAVAVSAANGHTGGEFIASLMRAESVAVGKLPGEVVVASSTRARIFRDDTPLREVRRSLQGILVVLP